MAHYHFDGEGKAFRPMLIFLLAKACNFHNNLSSRFVIITFNLNTVDLVIFACLNFQNFSGICPHEIHEN